jgi:DNA-binding transcriptional MerR regulator
LDGTLQRLPSALDRAAPEPHPGAQDLGFSLEQIRAMLDANLPSEVLRQMFNQKQAELQSRLADEQGRLQRVAERLQQIEQEGRLPGVEVTVKSIPVQWVVSQRTSLTFTDDLRMQIAPLCRQLSAQVMQVGLRSAPSWLVLQNGGQFSEHGLDVEVGLLLAESIPPGKSYPGVHIRRLHHQYGQPAAYPGRRPLRSLRQPVPLDRA